MDEMVGFPLVLGVGLIIVSFLEFQVISFLFREEKSLQEALPKKISNRQHRRREQWKRQQKMEQWRKQREAWKKSQGETTEEEKAETKSQYPNCYYKPPIPRNITLRGRIEKEGNIKSQLPVRE